MHGDGGFSDAQARRDFARELDSENKRRESGALDEAFARQQTRVKEAIAAFLKDLEEHAIAPEQIPVGSREIGPPGKLRFGPNAGGFRVWGFYRPPPPTQTVFEPGYTLWRRGDQLGELVLYASTMLIELRQRAPNESYSAQDVGVLPFYRSPLTGNPTPGTIRSAYPWWRVPAQIEVIQKTTDLFIDLLAGYRSLREHGGQGGG